MSSSGKTYKELAIPYFKEVFDVIDSIMRKNSTPFYLIGVNAMDLELLKSGVKPSRATKDIDFAIMISSMEDYQKITEDLLAHSFAKVEARWTFYNKKFNVIIDVLPFGEIEEEFTQKFYQRNIDLHVLGMKEVLNHPNEVQIEDKMAKIPPLPGMVVLKLVAWSDRPEERDTDPGDILKIIDHYFEHNFDEIVEFHNDIFPEENLDRLKIAARVLGRKSWPYIESSEKLQEKLEEIVRVNLENYETSGFIKNWSRNRNWDISYAAEILEEFQTGLKEDYQR